MAFITRDSSVYSEDASVAPSFVTSNDLDPFSSGAGVSVVYPDFKRNILEDLNNAENTTVLPPPSEKETLAVYLRVKPKTKEEAKIAEDSGVKSVDVENNLVQIESEYQVAMNAPIESQTYKSSINGTGKMTHRFSFTKIFSSESSQKDIFSKIVYSKLKDFVEGQNQLVFTYGATSAGKSYTMQGVPGQSGVLPRAIDTIFLSISDKLCTSLPLQPMDFNRVIGLTRQDLQRLEKEKESVFRLGMDLRQVKFKGRVSPSESLMSACSGVSTTSSIASSVYSCDEAINLDHLEKYFPGLLSRDKEATKLDIRDSNIAYSVWVSFAEIYNENIHDLLCKVPDGKKKGDKVKKPSLKLCEDRNGSVYIKGLREVQVNSADEAYQILLIGRENLHFAATRLNQQSSRSHCIFTVKLVRVADPDAPHLARVSMISFCDLAGSERISKTHNVGDRQKEAGNINTSLLVLGRCIKAIRHNQMMKEKNQQVVPFRESKLTRLFKCFLTGKGKACLVVCISQAPYLFDESIHVLKFASIASKVTITKKEPTRPKPSKKSSRFSTLVDKGKREMLSFGSSSILSGRNSIAWENPQKNKSILGRSIALPSTFNPNARSTIVGGVPPRLSTLINISEVEEGTNDDTEVEGSHETYVDSQYEGLCKLVEELNQKLKEERKKNQTLEKEVREELCEEFNQMLVEVESGWEKRLQAEKEDAEKISDWRIGALQTVHRNRNKRRRDNDGDDYQNDLEIHRLNSRLEEKDQQITDLCIELEESKHQIKVMKEATVSSKQEQEKLQMANSKLSFELAEQNRIVASLTEEATKCKIDLQSKTSSASDDQEGELVICERKLISAQEELVKKECDISELQDLLREAGDEFVSKEEELANLEKVIEDRERRIAQHEINIEDLQSQLEESHVLLQEVHNRLETLESELNQETFKKEEYNSLLKSQNEEVEMELKTVKDKCEEAETKMIQAQSERNQLLSDKTNLLEQLAALKESGNHQSHELEASVECIDLKQQVEVANELNKTLSVSVEDLKKQNEVLKSEIHSKRTAIEELKQTKCVDDSLTDFESEELKTKLSVVEKENVELQLEIAKYTEIVKEKDAEMETLKADKEKKEMECKLKDLEEQLEASEKLMEELIDDNEKEVKQLRDKFEVTSSELIILKESCDKVKSSIISKDKEIENLILKNRSELESKEEELREKDNEITKLSSKILDSKDVELGNKISYIKELEDIIVDKEYKMSQLEVDSNKKEGSLKKANALVEELRAKVDENSVNLSHYEKMKEQRESLEEQISSCQKAASELALIEDELKLCKESKKKLENELSNSNESCVKLKTELNEARGEVVVLKQATKTAAIDAQEAHEYKIKNNELTKELERLNSVLDASQRESDALDVLKTELVSKGNEISNIQEKLEHLHTELGAKNREVSQFREKNQVLQAEVEAKEYDLVKIKEERDKLMEHYEMLFKKKQAEIENLKSKEREKSSLEEIMARATPSKLTGDLKEKLFRAEEELATCKEKLVKEEDLTSELKNELNSLQKQMDTKVAQYEREVNRTKLANQKVTYLLFTFTCIQMLNFR